jgi:superfamily II DNA helicase RecQ
MTDARTAREVFGVRSLKPEQRHCIECVKSGVDVVAILPTGFGKSLCYQVPCVEMQGAAVIITPLLALALDQVQYLRAHGIKVVRFDSSVSLADRASIAIDLQRPDTNVKAVFTTPETLSRSHLLVESLQKAASHGNLSFVVVDEAHCVDMWSEFR